MKTGRLAFAVLMFGSAATVCMAASVKRPVSSVHEAMGSDGSNAARTATLLYNQLHPHNPLPLSGDNVVPDTLYNMGSGKSAKEAFSEASKSNAGLPAEPESVGGEEGSSSGE